MAQTTLQIQIKGMYCVNCETKIENRLKKKKGIQSISVNYEKNQAQISYDNMLITSQEIINIIEKMNYQVKIINEVASSSKQSIIKIIGIIVVIYAITLIFNQFGLINIFSQFPEATTGMSLSMIFVVGLLTSIHCIAMCGGINLSQSVCVKPCNEGKPNFKATFNYNAGRVISYTIIGGIVGGLGQAISFSEPMKGLVQISAGIFMVIMGLNMLDVIPALKRFNLKMPKLFASQKQSNNSFIVGLLNGLMPCGPLQTMQLYALSTGSILLGATSMFVFSLGTLPLMLGLGVISSLFTQKFTKQLLSVSAVIVLMMGIFMFESGLSFTGHSLPSFNSLPSLKSNSKQSSPTIIENGVQIVNTSMKNGYEPITVQVGVPVRWTINAPQGTLTPCNDRMVIPDLNYLEKQLVEGDNVIEFTPSQTGEMMYSCWMGMIRSKIIIVDKLEDQTNS